MKKIIRVFTWFCAATIIAQLFILGLSYLRGNLTQKSMVQIVALMNGIDIPGDRLSAAIAEAQDAPVLTREEILKAKVQASLELDTREKSLERWERSLQAEQSRQELESRDLARRIKEHDEAIENFKKGQQSESLAEVQKILSILPPDQAKVQILTMMRDGAVEDVLAIVKGMPEANRKKILAEFGEGDDSAKLSEILKALRFADAKPVSQPVNPADESSSVN